MQAIVRKHITKFKTGFPSLSPRHPRARGGKARTADLVLSGFIL